MCLEYTQSITSSLGNSWVVILYKSAKLSLKPSVANISQNNEDSGQVFTSLDSLFKKRHGSFARFD